MSVAGAAQLTVPCDTRFAAAVRLFAAAVARQQGCAEDVVQDFKIAVSEAFAETVAAAASGAGSLRLAMTPVQGAIRIELGAEPREPSSRSRRDTGPSDPGVRNGERDFSRALLSALFADATFGETGTRVAFSVPVGGSGVTFDGRPPARVRPTTPGGASATVPARAEFVQAIRSVAANVVGIADLPIDALDDLRIAVGEACVALLEHGDPSVLRIDVRPGDEPEVVVSTDATSSGWPPRGMGRRMAWMVLTALSSRPQFESDEGWPAVRLGASGPIVREGR